MAYLRAVGTPVDNFRADCTPHGTMYTGGSGDRHNTNIMNKDTFKQYIKKEIEKINVIIDKKIVDNKDYSKEAAKHYELLQQLRKIA